jgi:hypothetical protein
MFAASELILVTIAALAGVALFWVVGHEIEKDVSAIGSHVIDPAAQLVSQALNPFALAAGLLGIFLITRKGK